MPFIPQKFFSRDSHEVAKDLIGQKLCRRIRNRVVKVTLNEIEVYDGFEDRASHAFAQDGKKGRSAILFGPPGIWYVYLCYGVHWMLNVVTREEGYPAALLIRGSKEISGPGRLTRDLKIDRDLNGEAVLPESSLWFEKASSSELKGKKIISTPRIGINYSGPLWSQKKYRYLWK